MQCTRCKYQTFPVQEKIPEKTLEKIELQRQLDNAAYEAQRRSKLKKNASQRKSDPTSGTLPSSSPRVCHDFHQYDTYFPDWRRLRCPHRQHTLVRLSLCLRQIMISHSGVWMKKALIATGLPSRHHLLVLPLE